MKKLLEGIKLAKYSKDMLEKLLVGASKKGLFFSVDLDLVIEKNYWSITIAPSEAEKNIRYMDVTFSGDKDELQYDLVWHEIHITDDEGKELKSKKTVTGVVNTIIKFSDWRNS